VLNKELKEARNKINEQEEDGYVLGEKLTTLVSDNILSELITRYWLSAFFHVDIGFICWVVDSLFSL